MVLFCQGLWADKNTMVVDIKGLKDAKFASPRYDDSLRRGVDEPDTGNTAAVDVSEAFNEDYVGASGADVGEESPWRFSVSRVEHCLHTAIFEGLEFSIRETG